MSRTENMSLDFSVFPDTKKKIRAAFGETFSIHVTCCDNGKRVDIPAEETAFLRWCTPLGKLTENEGAVNSDGTVMVETTEEMTKCCGIHSADIVLRKGEEVLSTEVFNISVGSAQ